MSKTIPNQLYMIFRKEPKNTIKPVYYHLAKKAVVVIAVLGHSVYVKVFS